MANKDIKMMFNTEHPTYEIWDEMDTNQPYLMHRYYVLYIKYTYDHKQILFTIGLPGPDPVLLY